MVWSSRSSWLMTFLLWLMRVMMERNCDALSRQRFMRLKHANKVSDVARNPALWQTFQKQSSIALGPQTWVKDGEHATIGCAADEPSKSLLQTNDRLRHAVFKKARTTFVLDVTLASGHNRIRWDCKRQLVDDHTRQLLTAHVNSLPKACSSKQHGI